MTGRTDDVTIDAYPQRFVRPTTRKAVLAYLARLQERVAAGPELESFPEGALGVVVSTIVQEQADCCPDAGDLAHVRQALELVLAASFNSARASMRR